MTERLKRFCSLALHLTSNRREQIGVVPTQCGVPHICAHHVSGYIRHWGHIQSIIQTIQYFRFNLILFDTIYTKCSMILTQYKIYRQFLFCHFSQILTSTCLHCKMIKWEFEAFSLLQRVQSKALTTADEKWFLGELIQNKINQWKATDMMWWMMRITICGSNVWESQRSEAEIINLVWNVLEYFVIF